MSSRGGGERTVGAFPLLCFAVSVWGLSAAWSTVPYFGSCDHLPHGPCNAVPDLLKHSYCHRRHLLPLMATLTPVRSQPHCSVNWRRRWWPTGLGSRGAIKDGTWEHRGGGHGPFLSFHKRLVCVPRHERKFPILTAEQRRIVLSSFSCTVHLQRTPAG
jgi:hypothetical protein